MAKDKNGSGKQDPNAPYIGIDLGGTNIQVGLVVGKKLVARDSTKTKPETGADGVVDRINKLAQQVAEQAKVPFTDIAGIGIGAPGALDITTGTVIVAVNLGWKKFPLAKALGTATGRPVIVDNDVNVAVWGEYTAGAAQEFDSMLGIWLGTGVGGGLIFNGKLYHGHHGTAGEIGHTWLKADGPLGQRTVENLASRSSVVHQITQLIRTGHKSIIPDLVEGKLEKIRSKVLAESFKKGDALTVQVVEHTAHYVGIAAANAVTLLSLPCVVIGGGLTEALGDPLVKMVRDRFQKTVFPPELAEVKILSSKLHDDAGTIGAATLARDRLSA